MLVQQNLFFRLVLQYIEFQLFLQSEKTTERFLNTQFFLYIQAFQSYQGWYYLLFQGRVVQLHQLPSSFQEWFHPKSIKWLNKKRQYNAIKENNWCTKSSIITSTTVASLSPENDSPCKRCIMSISIPVLFACITLCTLEGNVWKWGKAIRDGVHIFSPVG